jgi:multiple sugar transport system ATP-binding protein
MNFLEGCVVEEGGRLWFDEGGGKLPVPAWASEVLAARVGSDVVLGVRPEALSDAAHARFETTDNSLQMKVKLVQPLGDKMDVYVSTGRHDLVAHLDAFFGLEAQQNLPLFVDSTRVHFFEPGELGDSLVQNPSMTELIRKSAAGPRSEA